MTDPPEALALVLESAADILGEISLERTGQYRQTLAATGNERRAIQHARKVLFRQAERLKGKL